MILQDATAGPSGGLKADAREGQCESHGTLKTVLRDGKVKPCKRHRTSTGVRRVQNYDIALKNLKGFVMIRETGPPFGA
jgi:hypothetical protein